jgi:hypothetical protein
LPAVVAVTAADSRKRNCFFQTRGHGLLQRSIGRGDARERSNAPRWALTRGYVAKGRRLFAQISRRFCDIRMKIDAQKIKPAVTRSERPAIVVARDAKTSANRSGTGRERRPLRCVIGLRSPASAMH